MQYLLMIYNDEAAMAKMTGLCLGPLFIAPIFVLAAHIGLQKNLHRTM